MKKLIFYILFFTSSLSFMLKSFAYEKEMSFSTSTYPFSQEHIPQYLESIDESTTLNEVIDFLFDLRKMLVSEGYSVPLFSEIFVTFLEQINTQPNISLDGEFILNFYHAIINKEQNLYSPTSLKLLKYLEKTKTQVFFAKETKETGIKISSGFAKGFCKAFGGALLCVIPHPITWGIGGGLIVSGVADMIESSDDSDGISMEELEKQLHQRQKMEIENTFLTPKIKFFKKANARIIVLDNHTFENEFIKLQYLSKNKTLNRDMRSSYRYTEKRKTSVEKILSSHFPDTELVNMREETGASPYVSFIWK